LTGPTTFDGFDADGEPVGRAHPSPWVQVSATSEDQTDNTYAQLLAMVGGSPVVDDCGLDVGVTRIFLRGRPGRLEPVSAAAGSREGQPVTAAILDETHLWTPRNGGVRLAATIRRNVGKTGGLSIETTNAHRPGDESVAEASWAAFEKGTAGLFYDSLEGPAVDDLGDRDKLTEALKAAYGGSAWVDLERVAEEVTDPATSPADARRFYLNQLVADADDLIEFELWQALERDDRLEAGDTVALGFDGSDTGDATALIAVRFSDWLVQPLGIWERPDDAPKDWRVPRSEVRAAVAEAFQHYRVVRMFCDPPYWRTEIDEWQAEHGDKVVSLFATQSDNRMVAAVDRWSTMVRAGQIGHTGNAVLDRHVANTQRRRARGGWRPEKAGHHRYIDAHVAAILAVEALGQAVSDGVTATPSARPVFAY
jgi:phage terminase large subunit-like protein